MPNKTYTIYLATTYIKQINLKWDLASSEMFYNFLLRLMTKKWTILIPRWEKRTRQIGISEIMYFWALVCKTKTFLNFGATLRFYASVFSNEVQFLLHHDCCMHASCPQHKHVIKNLYSTPKKCPKSELSKVGFWQIIIVLFTLTLTLTKIISRCKKQANPNHACKKEKIVVIRSAMP